jgi:hypothetical protein
MPLSPRRKPRAARSGGEPKPERLGHLSRVSAWAGLSKGDAVDVRGTKLRSATWEFVAHVTNVVTGDEWIEVVGGGPGERKLRSFAPDRIFAPTVRRHKPAAPLIDEPMLPL